MQGRMLLAALAAVVMCGTAASNAQDQPPRIRSGVELVSVDVQVVDGRGRPIADLTPADFEVFVGGGRRQVVTAELVQYGSSARAAERADTAAATPAPVTTEPDAPRRMYVIAVDEHSLRFGAARAAMEAARRFIARLEPGDLAGLFAYPTGTAQVDLTTNHAEVVAALDKVRAMYEMPRSNYNVSPAEAIDIANQDREVLARVRTRECRGDPYCRIEIPLIAQSMVITFEMTVAQSLGGLRGLIAGLGEIPGRKILVLVSGGLMMTDRPGRADDSARMMEVGALAARTNTTLYALHLDTRFLDTFGERQGSHTYFRDEGMFLTGLDTLAGAAGGTVFRLKTGSGDPAFDRVLLETSAHYLLGVEVADEDRDGTPRNIRVTVNRRGATVRSRSSVVIPGPG